MGGDLEHGREDRDLPGFNGAGRMEQRPQKVLPNLRDLQGVVRGRLFQVCAALVIAATAWLDYQNHQPVYHEPLPDPAAMKSFRKILDGTPHRTRENKRKNKTPFPDESSEEEDAIAIG